MSHLTLNAIAASNNDHKNFITADQLTEGDIIRTGCFGADALSQKSLHFTGDVWLVISEPIYTNQGITFDVIWLDVATPDNTQSVTFASQWRFELVSHQSSIMAEAA